MTESNKETKVRLSQCMIVKNEEANIEKALAWGKKVACEQIVVDTGSTDRTVELAKAMGAKVFSFDWIDDFAAAKNFAISKANGDWIAFLDADEVFISKDETKLIAVLEQIEQSGKSIDAIWITRLEINDNGNVFGSITLPRIFRKVSGLEYFGRIHEYLKWDDGSQLQIFDASEQIFVLHSGYQKEAKNKKNKSRRNQKLILREIEEHPDDYHMMGYLGDDYFSREQRDEAAVWYQKAIDAMPKVLDSHDQRSAVTFCNLMKILGLDSRNGERLQALYQIAISRLPEEPDFDYIYGLCFMEWQKYEKAKKYLEQALQKLKRLEQSGTHSRALELNGNLLDAFVNLAWCCVQTGDVNRAVSLSVEVLRADNANSRALRILLRAFRGMGSSPIVTPKQVLDFLAKICDVDSLRGRYLILYAAKEAPYPELVQYMERMFTPEERAGLEEHGL